jgi:hypothetical protein
MTHQDCCTDFWITNKLRQPTSATIDGALAAWRLLSARQAEGPTPSLVAKIRHLCPETAKTHGILWQIDDASGTISA